MERMGAFEFLEWMILESVEPFGEKAHYLRAGVSFDFHDGIGKDQPSKSSKRTQEDIKMTTPDGMNAAMQVFSMLNPGAIRMKPKKPS